MSCNFKESSRPGLYVMVFFALMYSCNVSERTDRLVGKLCPPPIEASCPTTDELKNAPR